MKKNTAKNLTTIIAFLAIQEGGTATVDQIVAATGINVHQVNAMSGIWANKTEAGATPELFARETVGKFTFLVLTEAGRTWKPVEAAAKVAKEKPVELSLEGAREALAARLAVSAQNVHVEV